MARPGRGPLLAAVLAVVAGGCAGGGARPPAGAADPAVAPWQVPPAAVGTQRLYRMSYDGPQQGGSFRLSLRLASRQRYEVRAVDPAGRSLWTLAVSGEEGLWLDHRARAACRLAGNLDLAAAELTPFPLPAVPALLLGRLPAEPAGPVEEAAGAGEEDDEGEGDVGEAAVGVGGDGVVRIAYRDARERRWTATLEGGEPRSWSMSEVGAGSPSLWWLRRGGEAVLSDRIRGAQLRWRQTLAEPLGEGLAAPRVPADFSEVPCDALYGGRPAAASPFDTTGKPF
jgi:hypothetical protein